jgi:hypothetical protein
MNQKDFEKLLIKVEEPSALANLRMIDIDEKFTNPLVNDFDMLKRLLTYRYRDAILAVMNRYLELHAQENDRYKFCNWAIASLKDNKDLKDLIPYILIALKLFRSKSVTKIVYDFKSASLHQILTK